MTSPVESISAACPEHTDGFVDGRLSRYGAAKASFCQGLAANGFTARCR
ncbi:hypothetical protein ACF064_21325 [Streptomyces sp. NPDC015492]